LLLLPSLLLVLLHAPQLQLLLLPPLLLVPLHACSSIQGLGMKIGL
jgi:hypothetical protein